VEVRAIDGTFISSQMNKNSESLKAGFFEADASFLKLIDITTNNNGDSGIFTLFDSQSLEIIKSTACFNDAFDGSAFGLDMDIPNTQVAQGNTCDTSFDEFLNGRRFCECPCPQRKKSSVTNSVVGTTSTANTTEANRTKFATVVLRNQTVAAIVRGG
jgi:hypothetical protein